MDKLKLAPDSFKKMLYIVLCIVCLFPFVTAPMALFAGLAMMIGFVAEANDNHPITIDNKEITLAQWFVRGNLPAHPSAVSIAGEMIEKFEKGELTI